MYADQPPDLASLLEQLDAADADARALVEGLDESTGTARPNPGSWSIAQCLDHLATANAVYVAAMRPSAERARTGGRARRGPARPGLAGRAFIRWMEPPVRRKGRAPAKIQPRPSPPLGESARAFARSQDEVRAFIREFAGIDLTGTRFPNPFVRGVRFSLATGLNVITSHDRRHLWQAWNIRKTLGLSDPPRPSLSSRH